MHLNGKKHCQKLQPMTMNEKETVEMNLRNGTIEEKSIGSTGNHRKNPFSAGCSKWCDICGVLVSGPKNYEMHLNGKKHRLKLQLITMNEKEPAEMKNLCNGTVKEKSIGSTDGPELVPGEPVPPGLEGVVKSVSQVEPELNSRTEWPLVEVPELAPGEPVPPGLEGVVKSVSQIEVELNSHTELPLIGLEYLVEATVDDDPSTLEYFCLLCDKKGPKRIVISHLTSFNHQMKYLKLYFPSVYEYLEKLNNDQESKKIIGKIISGVSAKIEKCYGRLKPLVVEKKTLLCKKGLYLEKINREAHFREAPGINLIDMETASEEESKQQKTDEEKDKLPDAVSTKSDDSNSDDIQVISVFRKSKVNIGKKLPTEDTRPTKELIEKEETRGEVSHVVESSSESEGTDVLTKGGNCSGKEKRDGSHHGSLSSISSSSSSDSSFRKITFRSPNHQLERRLHRRCSSERSRKLWKYETSQKAMHYREQYNVKYARRPRSRSRSKSGERVRSGSYSGSVQGSRRQSRLGARHRIQDRSRSRSRSLTLSTSPSPIRYTRKEHSQEHSPSTSRTHKKHRPGRLLNGHRNHGSHVDDREGTCNKKKGKSEYSVWEEFRMEADALEVDMLATRQRFERSPEKHPSYAVEWRNFYSWRMEEMKGKKAIEPRSEEFKLEWIAYWGEKMNELLNQELREKKEAIRKRLGLPEEGQPQPRFELKRKHDSRDNNSEGEDDWIPPPPQKLRERLSSPCELRLSVLPEKKSVTISDMQSTWKALTGAEIGSESDNRPQKVCDVSETCWSHSVTGLISTLRIISALEEQLGSLGPRINTHLSQALTVHRSGGLLSPLVYSSDIVVLLETVKEKLIGQLQAKIVRRSMIAAVERGIGAISNLLVNVSSNRAAVKSGSGNEMLGSGSISCNAVASTGIEKKGEVESVTQSPIERATESATTPETIAGVLVPGIGKVDKCSIAQQIAEVLIAKGRTDVTEVELQTLVADVVGLAQTQAANKNHSVVRTLPDLSVEEWGDHSTSSTGSSDQSSDKLTSSIAYHLSTSKTPSVSSLNVPQESKYSLIKVDLEENACQKCYQDLSMKTARAAMERRLNLGESCRETMKDSYSLTAHLMNRNGW